MSTSSARVHQYDKSSSGDHPIEQRVTGTAIASRFLYAFGDWMYSLAVVILAYQLTGKLTAVAVVLLFQAAGRLLGVSISPSIGDPRKLIRFVLGVGIARALLIASLVFATTEDGLWLAMIAAGVLGALSPIGEGAQRALLPARLPHRHVRNLRSRLVCRWDQMAMIAGSIAAGLVIVVWSEQAAFVIAAVASIPTVILVSSSARKTSSTPPPSLPSRREIGSSPTSDRRTLHVLMLALAAGAALGIAIRILLVEIVLDDHGSSELAYGLFVALAGVGAFAGPLSIPRLLGKLPSELVLAGVTVALAIALIATHIADPLGLIIPIVIGCGILAITGERAGETVIRRVVPDRELDSALRLLTTVMIAGQVVALTIIAGLYYLSGITLVIMSLALVSIFSASIPILTLVNRRSQPTRSGGD